MREEAIAIELIIAWPTNIFSCRRFFIDECMAQPQVNYEINMDTSMNNQDFFLVSTTVKE